MSNVESSLTAFFNNGFINQEVMDHYHKKLVIDDSIFVERVENFQLVQNIEGSIIINTIYNLTFDLNQFNITSRKGVTVTLTGEKIVFRNGTVFYGGNVGDVGVYSLNLTNSLMEKIKAFTLYSDGNSETFSIPDGTYSCQGTGYFTRDGFLLEYPKSPSTHTSATIALE